MEIVHGAKSSFEPNWVEAQRVVSYVLVRPVCGDTPWFRVSGLNGFVRSFEPRNPQPGYDSCRLRLSGAWEFATMIHSIDMQSYSELS